MVILRYGNGRKVELTEGQRLAVKKASEIEKTADIISFLYRDEYYNSNTQAKNIIEVTTSKQRNGATGVVKLKFYGEIQRIV